MLSMNSTPLSCRETCGEYVHLPGPHVMYVLYTVLLGQAMGEASNVLIMRTGDGKCRAWSCQVGTRHH